MKAEREIYNGVWDAEVDVVVVGAGGAGLVAGMEAASLGVQTLVLEKQAKISDCSTALSGGGLSFAGTDFQEREGIHDSNALLYKDLMEVGEGKNDRKLVQAYVRNQLNIYRWLTRLGVKWVRLDVTMGMSVPRVHKTDPLELVYILKQAAESKGATIVFQTRVTGLITEEKRVIGVSVEETTGSTRVRARKGVVLACGGFARDPKRLDSIDPRLSKLLAASGKGNSGDGHRMAEELGAFFKDLDNIEPTFACHVTGTSAAEQFSVHYLGAIIVNKKSKRFFDESRTEKDIGRAALGEPDGIGYQIFDNKIYEAAVRIVEESAMPLPTLTKGLDQTRINLLVKADTIEALASQISVPPQTLKETIERYNNNQVDAGRDLDFGRTTLAGGFGRIVRLDTSPFYAYATKNMLTSTLGGIAVDEDMHVLTRQGRIRGLYAAGEIVGGFHGAGYMGGTAVGKAIIFGRIAGRNAAKER